MAKWYSNAALIDKQFWGNFVAWADCPKWQGYLPMLEPLMIS